MEEPPGEYEGCDHTDSNGEYAIRSLPAGTYLVAFEKEYLPFGMQVGQWWDGASSAADATPITIEPPETRTGVDGRLANRYPTPTPEAPVVIVQPQPNAPVAKKCRKGFRSRTVGGRTRCVRKHRRHRRHRRVSAASR
jgi:hypothetical protein